MADSPPSSRRSLLIKSGIFCVVCVIGMILLARGYDLKGAYERGMATVREAGPTAFFIAMALLPAIGAPQSAFTLTAGPLFGPRLGMPLVVFLGCLAAVVNMTLTYWLARTVMRPLLEKLVIRLGYKLPEVKSGNAVDMIVLLRVTPGFPFPVQNYLLGLANIAFGKYLLVSCLCSLPFNAAFIWFGDALLQGKGRIALIAFMCVAALLAGAQLLRKHYSRKSSP